MLNLSDATSLEGVPIIAAFAVRKGPHVLAERRGQYIGLPVIRFNGLETITELGMRAIAPLAYVSTSLMNSVKKAAEMMGHWDGREAKICIFVFDGAFIAPRHSNPNSLLTSLDESARVNFDVTLNQLVCYLSEPLRKAS